MDTESIFNQNVDYLIQIRDEVSRCNQLEQYSKQLKETVLKIVNARITFEKSRAYKTYQKREYDWWSEFKANHKIICKDIKDYKENETEEDCIVYDCITKNCMDDWDGFIRKINEINW